MELRLSVYTNSIHIRYLTGLQQEGPGKDESVNFTPHCIVESVDSTCRNSKCGNTAYNTTKNSQNLNL